MHLQNFSNQLTEGVAVAKVTGRFTGSGRTVVGTNFRPETQGPDFALAASVALANKHARMVWALLAYDHEYHARTPASKYEYQL